MQLKHISTYVRTTGASVAHGKSSFSLSAVAYVLLFMAILILQPDASYAANGMNPAPATKKSSSNTTKNADTPPGIAYTPVVEGSPNEKMLEAFQAVSKCFTLKDSPPESLLLLNRRMTGDIDSFMQVLRSFGYFKAEVVPTLEQNTVPPTVRFKVTPGVRFKWARVEFISVVDPSGDPPSLPLPGETGIVTGQPYAASQVSDAESSILKQLRTQSYPFPKIASRKVIANFADNLINLTLKVNAGKKAKFGKVSFKGLKNVKEDYIRTFITWEYGAPYNAEETEKCRNSLIRSGLFSLARIEPGKVDAEGYLPLTVDVTERKPRTFGAGVRYRSDDGPGGKIGWEHRSIFGRGELLKLAIDGDMKQQSFTADFRKPSLFIKESGSGGQSKNAAGTP